ncbi:MAG TPA: helix-turn-helix domain-containing protein [Acidimicrobiales bacterium]|nr:helix-turn-helix domain-containing protein [Acidimicrobiales bacterium]
MPEATTALDSLPATRRQILQHIKMQGEAAADDLARHLRLTVTAVRQHLTGLAADGLVEHRPAVKGPGRPRHLFRLTSRGHALFPAAYGELTNELLGYFSEDSPELVDRVFERRGRRRTEGARARLEGRDLPGRVAELARILDEDGYLADFEQVDDDTWRITEHNCAVFAVASRYGQACSSEIAFLRQALPDADIERVSHMVAGAHACSYLVRRRPA